MNRSILGYDLREKIGKGTFGQVRKAIHLSTGQMVAIKLLQKKRIILRTDLQRVQKEMSILKQVEHPNIVRLLQLAESPRCYYIVTQMLQGKELYQYINDEGCPDETHTGILFVQLVDAVAYLHSRFVCHRDIKPQNIILNGTDITLIDFGLSSHYDPGAKLSTSCGSPCYAAPEMVYSDLYNPEKVDVWALGITLYAMLRGRLPFQHDNVHKLYELIHKSHFDPIPGVSSKLNHLLCTMIDNNPRTRINLNEVQNHPWLLPFRKHLKNKDTPWNEMALLRTAGRLNKTVENIRQQYSNKSSWGTATHYYLLMKRQQSKDAPDQIQIHQGPVHLGMVFETLAQAKSFVDNIIKLQWLTTYEGFCQGSFVLIKAFGSFFYITLNKKAANQVDTFLLKQKTGKYSYGNSYGNIRRESVEKQEKKQKNANKFLYSLNTCKEVNQEEESPMATRRMKSSQVTSIEKINMKCELKLQVTDNSLNEQKKQK